MYVSYQKRRNRERMRGAHASHELTLGDLYARLNEGMNEFAHQIIVNTGRGDIAETFLEVVTTEGMLAIGFVIAGLAINDPGVFIPAMQIANDAMSRLILQTPYIPK